MRVHDERIITDEHEDSQETVRVRNNKYSNEHERDSSTCENIVENEEDVPIVKCNYIDEMVRFEEEIENRDIQNLKEKDRPAYY